MTYAAGQWVEVEEREPKTGTVVLAEWKDGAVRVVTWSPKSSEGVLELANDPFKRTFCIWLAHIEGGSAGVREWPVRWAEIVSGGRP